MSKHTPGPWETEHAPEFEDSEIDGSLFLVKSAKSTGLLAEGRANARLIAAAPELLEALKALRLQALQSEMNTPSHEWGYEAIQMANAAISKAEATT